MGAFNVYKIERLKINPKKRYIKLKLSDKNVPTLIVNNIYQDIIPMFSSIDKIYQKLVTLVFGKSMLIKINIE